MLSKIVVDNLDLAPDQEILAGVKDYSGGVDIIRLDWNVTLQDWMVVSTVYLADIIKVYDFSSGHLAADNWGRVIVSSDQKNDQGIEMAVVYEDLVHNDLDTFSDHIIDETTANLDGRYEYTELDSCFTDTAGTIGHVEYETDSTSTISRFSPTTITTSIPSDVMHIDNPENVVNLEAQGPTFNIFTIGNNILGEDGEMFSFFIDYGSVSIKFLEDIPFNDYEFAFKVSYLENVDYLSLTTIDSSGNSQSIIHHFTSTSLIKIPFTGSVRSVILEFKALTILEQTRINIDLLSIRFAPVIMWADAAYTEGEYSIQSFTPDSATSFGSFNEVTYPPASGIETLQTADGQCATVSSDYSEPFPAGGIYFDIGSSLPMDTYIIDIKNGAYFSNIKNVFLAIYDTPTNIAQYPNIGNPSGSYSITYTGAIDHLEIILSSVNINSLYLIDKLTIAPQFIENPPPSPIYTEIYPSDTFYSFSDVSGDDPAEFIFTGLNADALATADDDVLTVRATDYQTHYAAEITMDFADPLPSAALYEINVNINYWYWMDFVELSAINQAQETILISQLEYEDLDQQTFYYEGDLAYLKLFIQSTDIMWRSALHIDEISVHRIIQTNNPLLALPYLHDDSSYVYMDSPMAPSLGLSEDILFRTWDHDDFSDAINSGSSGMSDELGIHDDFYPLPGKGMISMYDPDPVVYIADHTDYITPSFSWGDSVLTPLGNIYYSETMTAFATIVLESPDINDINPTSLTLNVYSDYGGGTIVSQNFSPVNIRYTGTPTTTLELDYYIDDFMQLHETGYTPNKNFRLTDGQLSCSSDVTMSMDLFIHDPAANVNSPVELTTVIDTPLRYRSSYFSGNGRYGYVGRKY